MANPETTDGIDGKDADDKELFMEFVVESQEGLAEVENQMLAIEAAGSDIDTDLVNAVFRTMHSIKGGAGFLGLDRIGALAHALEEVLNNLRNREIVPTSPMVTSVLLSADIMKGLLDNIDTSNEADVSEYVTLLQQFRPGATPIEPAHDDADAAAKSNEPSVAAPSPSPSTSTPHVLSERAVEFLTECRENLLQTERDLEALQQSPESDEVVRRIFRSIHAIHVGAELLGLCSLEELARAGEEVVGLFRDGELTFGPEFTSALALTVEQCQEVLGLFRDQGNDAGFDPEPTIHQLSSLKQQASGQTNARPSDPPAADGGAPATLATPSTAATVASDQKKSAPGSEQASGEKAPLGGDTTIRVDVALLDKLMTRVGELVLARNQVLQYTSNLDDSSFVSTAQRLNLITTELQESVMKTRMQPIGNVWAKFPRVVRDLASQLGKQIRIEMEGKETELDKTIVEAIKDPLTHLVRNSVDHGVESPEARIKAGKPAEGRLFLRAFHEGGQVNIEITDDGAGLNVDRIRQKAIERGIVSSEQATRMTDREAAQLIMLPGFSTAQQVTSVSGRGVGMDVVKTNIERIGGMIDIQSRPGQGTTVNIKIPLTLAIIPALVVTSDGDRYAIPQVSLLELVRLEGEQIEREIEFVHGAPVYRLRGKLLPLLYLSEQLHCSSDANGGESASGGKPTDRQVVNIVVLRANDEQFGLVVDSINDTEEIVVKPLSRQLKNLREYAGATIMGDGTVALILDVTGVAIAAGLASEMSDKNLSSQASGESQGDHSTQSLIIVGLGESRRFALPTSMVSRLEKVSVASIELADGQEVLQYRGAILPLVRLEDVFPGSHQSDAEELQIVVYAEQGHSYGLIVHHILDVVDTELTYHSRKEEGDNLIGTAVIQGKVTDVLNLRSLARHASESFQLAAV